MRLRHNRHRRRAGPTLEGAAAAMDKKLAEFSWVVGDSTRPELRNTSHSGRMTGVSIDCQLGASKNGSEPPIWDTQSGLSIVDQYIFGKPFQPV